MEKSVAVGATTSCSILGFLRETVFVEKSDRGFRGKACRPPCLWLCLAGLSRVAYIDGALFRGRGGASVGLTES